MRACGTSYERLLLAEGTPMASRSSCSPSTWRRTPGRRPRPSPPSSAAPRRRTASPSYVAIVVMWRCARKRADALAMRPARRHISPAIPRVHNAVRRDGSAAECRSYFCAGPYPDDAHRAPSTDLARQERRARRSNGGRATRGRSAGSRRRPGRTGSWGTRCGSLRTSRPSTRPGQRAVCVSGPAGGPARPHGSGCGEMMTRERRVLTSLGPMPRIRLSSRTERRPWVSR